MIYGVLYLVLGIVIDLFPVFISFRDCVFFCPFPGLFSLHLSIADLLVGGRLILFGQGAQSGYGDQSLIATEGCGYWVQGGTLPCRRSVFRKGVLVLVVVSMSPVFAVIRNGSGERYRNDKRKLAFRAPHGIVTLPL